MTAKPQKLLTALIISILITSFAYSLSDLNVKAEEQTIKQKAVASLTNVVGLDTSKYQISATQCSNDSYRDTLARENVRTTLTAEGSKVQTLCTFINGSLQKIYVCSNEGSPHMNTPSTSDVAMAQNFLTGLQAQSRNPFYGDLNAIVAKVDTNKNSSTTIGNLRLNVTARERETSFLWTYTSNGIEAPDKCVVLRYTNGFLNYFVDNWDLYRIGNTNVNLSGQEAIAVAMERAKNYSPDSPENGTIGGIKFNVTNAMIIETILAPSVYVDTGQNRSQDFLELYPMYNVWVSLDKFYPGNVYGFNVYVWADTGQVCYIHQRVSTIDPPAELIASPSDTNSTNNQTLIASSLASLEVDNSLSGAWLMLPAGTAAVFAVIAVYLCNKKKAFPFQVLPRTRWLKVSGASLCLLVLSLLFAATILALPVAAEVIPLSNGGASVWGAESTGSINYNLNPPVWRVGIALNKWYGYMYDIQVDIWADTGEVRYVQEAWSTMPPPENTPTANITAIQESNSQLSNKSNIGSSDQVSLSAAQPDIA